MAASADEVISELQDMLECPVCLDPFKAPRTLQCQHSFCTTCLQGLLGPGRQIRCPCCNKKTPVPDGVQELPVDFRANKQLEMLSKYKKAKEAKKADSEPAAAAAAAAAAVIPQGAFGCMSLDERCPVCEDILTVSKNLSCGHSLCRNCVQFLLPVGDVTLHCPTCSRQTTVVMTSNTGLHTPSLQVRRGPSQSEHQNPSTIQSTPQPFLLSAPQAPVVGSLLGSASRPSGQPETRAQAENVPAESRLTSHSVCGKDAIIDPNRITTHREEGAFGLLSLDQRCPACNKILTGSKNFSCGHSLCESCVQFLLSFDGDTLHCPTCYHQTLPSQRENGPAERLTFHSVCGKNAVIHANKITAHKKEPQTIWSDALVLTSRHLKPNELFEVRLDKKVDKHGWSVEIGVTRHPPTESALRLNISNLDSDTWFMADNEVFQIKGNKLTAIKTYKQDLYDLKVGDRVGVQRKEDGDLHFYINSADLGVAVSGVPGAVYGVISVFCTAEQVTITDTSGTDTGEAM